MVGGGPAGSATAITLADAGHEVTLVDKAVFPRDKCCGDGLTTGALRILDRLGFEPAMVDCWQEVSAAWIRSPSGREVCFPLGSSGGTYAAVVPRVELDRALLELAADRGVKVHQGHPFAGFGEQEDHRRVVAEIDGLGPITADYLVAADGMWSPVRRALGLNEPGYLGEWHAFRQYFSNVTGSAAERLHVWFEPDLLPGYAWSFPLPDGRANLGFGIERGGRVSVRQMKQLWPELLARPHVAAALGPAATADDRHLAWPIPGRIDRAVLGRDRVLFVGDAACAGDPLTGEGIGQALLTGVLAAEAIDAGGPVDPARTRGRYRASVEAALFADHRMSVVLIARPAPRVGCPRLGPRRRCDRLDPGQFRPLVVRGRAEGDRPHAPTLAPRLPPPTRGQLPQQPPEPVGLASRRCTPA